MGNPYPATFIDQNAEGRLVGELDFTDAGNRPGGSPVAGAVLIYPTQSTYADVAAGGTYPFNWGAAIDDLWNQSAAPIPSGLAITAALDGSANSITTTAAGTWAFTFLFQRNSALDPTWAGVFQDGLYPSTVLLSGISLAVITEVLTLPTGAVVAPEFITQTPATNAMTMQVLCNVSRLA